MREGDLGYPLIISVVGIQDAGKTTLVTRMCAVWKQQGRRVGVIKHDGHADAAERDDWEKEGSDTVRYAEAGADMTMVTGGGQSLLRIVNDPHASDIHTLSRRLSALAAQEGMPLDVIIVEGYKGSDLPKIVPVRRRSDVDWLAVAKLQNVHAVVSTADVISLVGDKWHVYHEDDIADLCEDLWR